MSETQAAPKPKVTVIVAAYNAAATLERAVRSALAEPVPLEVIVVDDASKDETLALARRLAAEDARVRCIGRLNNGGVSRVRNDALAKARGEWVTPLDADDCFAPNRLSELVALGEAQSADLVADNIMGCDQDLNPQEPLYDFSLYGESKALGLNAFLASCDPRRSDLSLGYLKPLIRRSFLEAQKLEYDPEVQCAEDWLLYLGCLLGGARMVLHPQAKYHYARYQQSTSRSRERMVINVEHHLLCFEHARDLAVKFGNDEVAAQIAEWLPHMRRLLKKQQFKKALLDQPAIAAVADWLKAAKRAAL